jgi:hypothetical protein
VLVVRGDGGCQQSLARHLGYGFLPVPRVDLATIAAAAGGHPIFRDEVCNRSDDGKPPLELSERTGCRR